MTFLLRRLDEDDVPAVQALGAEVLDTVWSLDAFYAHLQSPSNLSLGVFRPIPRDQSAVFSTSSTPSSQLLGYIWGHIIPPEAELHALAVQLQYRGQGLGGLLLSAFISTLTRSGITTLHLEVAQDNAPALGLYRQYGFVVTGERPNYYTRPTGTHVTALMMQYHDHCAESEQPTPTTSTL